MSWAKNLFLVKQLDDDQMQAISHPRLELHVHVMYKTVEAGVILGGIIGPAVALLRKRPVGATTLRYARNGAIIGAVAGPLMTEMVVRGQPDERIYDRSYRLRYNRDQVRVDRAVSYGAAVGAATSAFMGHGALPGFLIGIGASCIAGGFYNGKFANDPPKPKKEAAKIEEVPQDETKTE